MSVAEVISVRPEAFAAGLSSNPTDFDQLPAGDKVYFISSIFGLFKYYELMFMEYKDGNTDDISWNAWSQHMLMQFHQPGVRAWWSLREATFHPEFRNFLNESERPNLMSFAELIVQHDQ